MKSGKAQFTAPFVERADQFPWVPFCLINLFSIIIHFFRVGWGDLYRSGLFQFMEDDHLSAYCLYWADASVYMKDVIRERALTMTAGSIQRWLPVLLHGFPSPNLWSQGWALFQEVGIAAGVFWLAWLAFRRIPICIVASLVATAANPTAWNWAVFSGGFLYDYPASAALVVVIACLGLLLQGQWQWMPLFSFFGALLHPSIGIWSGLILAIFLLFETKAYRLRLVTTVLAGPLLVAVGQILLGTLYPVNHPMTGKEFQELCRLNWHLQPWWEPASGVFLARLVNGFLPCCFLVLAAMADRDFRAVIQPDYYQLIVILTLASWAGFILGLLFFYTGIPTLILSSPVRLGAIWGYAVLPMLVAHFQHLLTRRKAIEGCLCLFALVGLFVWDKNVFLRYPATMCAFGLWIRQYPMRPLLQKILSVVSVFVCGSWCMVLLTQASAAIFDSMAGKIFSVIKSARPGWTEASWEANLNFFHDPWLLVSYGCISLVLAELFWSRRSRVESRLLWLGAALTAILLDGVWRDRQAREEVALEAKELARVGDALPKDGSTILSPDNRSLRCLLRRPVVLLGFYDGNIYTHSKTTQDAQKKLLEAMKVPYPKNNSEVYKLKHEILLRIPDLSAQAQESLSKISGSNVLLFSTMISEEYANSVTPRSGSRNRFQVVWLGSPPGRSH